MPPKFEEWTTFSDLNLINTSNILGINPKSWGMGVEPNHKWRYHPHFNLLFIEFSRKIGINLLFKNNFSKIVSVISRFFPWLLDIQKLKYNFQGK
jgi:hypothetical protein